MVTFSDNANLSRYAKPPPGQYILGYKPFKYPFSPQHNRSVVSLRMQSNFCRSRLVRTHSAAKAMINTGLNTGNERGSKVHIDSETGPEETDKNLTLHAYRYIYDSFVY
jgi:hypothetical protein